MGKKLYLECYAGISGDMTVAALLDLGASERVLRKALDTLQLDGYEIAVSHVKKAGFYACDFEVKLDREHENHDHDMSYLHGHAHDHDFAHAHLHEQMHDHGHAHNHGHGHDHDHDHAHDHGHDHDHDHTHAHRGLPEIQEIFCRSGLTQRARETAMRIFDILADAEAKAHGVPRDKVHFHEVGAIDSIVDVAAVAVCLDDLDVTEVIVPVLYEGCGSVRCQHGVIPIPVPATLNIVRAHGLRLHQSGVEGEFVTPTGAAIVAAIKTGDALPEVYTVQRVGIGAGKRTYERPSILRAMLIEEACEAGADKSDRVCKLECNVDDCSGEALGYALGKLMDSGARDVHYTPVYMKKNRPGWLITVLCDLQDRERMEQILFAETTTIGIRRQMMERTVLERENIRVATSLGEVDVKVLRKAAGERYASEYESIVKIAEKTKLPFREVMEIVMAELYDKKGEIK